MAGGGYDLEEIRRRADVVELVSPHVALRKSGRRLTGLCPFHQERTPSFTVDAETGLWHCFGCKAGGDVFRFVEMIEKVTFREAVELLARRLGVSPRRPADAARHQERERLLRLHEVACRFFHDRLSSQAGRPARTYLEGRGISPESIEGFGLGYAPAGWDALLTALGKRGYSGQELARAGLVVPREGRFYDRFRDRIVFPISDPSGRVIAFGGRALSDDQQPKYLNSPESPLFQKGRTLYALDRARRAMDEAGRAIVVEGYLDAIACHEAGLAETVATMGTALTADHVGSLRRRVSQLVLAFDADSAGLAAALRSRELFQQADLAVRVASLPEGVDPDQVIRERDRDAFHKLVSEAVPMVEWELSRVLRDLRKAGGGARVEGMRDAVAVLARITPGMEREYYIRWLAQQWESGSPSHVAATEAAVRQELARMTTRTARERRRTGDLAPRGQGGEERPPGTAAVRVVEAELLGAFIRHGDLAARYGPRLGPEDFQGRLRSVFAAIRSLTDGGQPVTPQAVLAQLEPEARGELARLLISDVPEDRLEESVASAVARLLEGQLLRRERALRQRLVQGAPEDQVRAIQEELARIRSERSQLAGQRLVG